MCKAIEAMINDKKEETYKSVVINMLKDGEIYEKLYDLQVSRKNLSERLKKNRYKIYNNKLGRLSRMRKFICGGCFV